MNPDIAKMIADLKPLDLWQTIDIEDALETAEKTYRRRVRDAKKLGDIKDAETNQIRLTRIRGLQHRMMVARFKLIRDRDQIVPVPDPTELKILQEDPKN